jgi:hypothetical protein
MITFKELNENISEYNIILLILKYSRETNEEKYKRLKNKLLLKKTYNEEEFNEDFIKKYWYDIKLDYFIDTFKCPRKRNNYWEKNELIFLVKGVYLCELCYFSIEHCEFEELILCNSCQKIYCNKCREKYYNNKDEIESCGYCD